jgi:hypothetical protein
MSTPGARGQWTTSRGEEGLYRDHKGEMSVLASHLASPRFVRLEQLNAGACERPISSERLLTLLNRTRRQFPDFENWVGLEVESLLEELSAGGELEWERMQHPYSKLARIIRLGRRPP